jgi:hypothetical protein
VGHLPPGSGPTTITLLTALAPGAPSMVTLANTVDIGSAPPEVETLNNQAQAQVWIGWRILLSIVLREY